MKNYDTYIFKHRSHWNEYAPDTLMRFTTHQEENLDEVIDMVNKFLLTCGYSQESIKQAMADFAEY